MWETVDKLQDIEKNQVRVMGVLDQVTSSEGGKKMIVFCGFLQVEPIDLPDQIIMRCERRRGINNDQETFGLNNGKA